MVLRIVFRSADHDGSLPGESAIFRFNYIGEVSLLSWPDICDVDGPISCNCHRRVALTAVNVVTRPMLTTIYGAEYGNARRQLHRCRHQVRLILRIDGQVRFDECITGPLRFDEDCGSEPNR